MDVIQITIPLLNISCFPFTPLQNIFVNFCFGSCPVRFVGSVGSHQPDNIPSTEPNTLPYLQRPTGTNIISNKTNTIVIISIQSTFILVIGSIVLVF